MNEHIEELEGSDPGHESSGVSHDVLVWGAVACSCLLLMPFAADAVSSRPVNIEISVPEMTAEYVPVEDGDPNSYSHQMEQSSQMAKTVNAVGKDSIEVLQPVDEPEPQPQPKQEDAKKESDEHAGNAKAAESARNRNPVSSSIEYTEDFVEPSFSGLPEGVAEPVFSLPFSEMQGTEGQAVPVMEEQDFTWVTGRSFDGMTRAEKVELIGQMARADYRESGILPSVTAAQLICESGVLSGGSRLSNDYNNYFGIKASTSGYTWKNSTWTGHIVNMATKEEYTPGVITDTVSAFRAYDSVWDSVKDHSAYLAYTTNGNKLRYEGVVGCADPAQAIHIIKSGGYATGSSYEQTLMSIIDAYDLTRFDRF